MGTKGVIITPAQTDPQAIVDVMQKNKIPMIVLEGLFSVSSRDRLLGW